jgi:hypothetical protein
MSDLLSITLLAFAAATSAPVTVDHVNRTIQQQEEQWWGTTGATEDEKRKKAREAVEFAEWMINEDDSQDRYIYYKQGPLSLLWYSSKMGDAALGHIQGELLTQFVHPRPFTEIKVLFPSLVWNGVHQQQELQCSFVFHFVAGSPQHLLVPVRIIPSDKWKRGVSVSEEGKKLCQLQNNFLETGEMSEEIEAVVETVLFKF